jgi:DNA-directed RNA polymerase specialized sigma24 family protein
MSAREEQKAELAAAVAALLASFRGEGEITQAELDRLLTAATGFLQATSTRLSHDERVDVVDGALLELLELEVAGKLDPGRDAAGLFLTIVQRRGIDQFRLARRQDVPLNDEEAAAGAEPAPEEEETLLDALASKEELAAMMGELARQGRPDLNAVIRVWLDLIHQLGTASSVLVAQRLGLDRSTVNRRLAEIRALLGGRERS